ncbi:MAG: bifunctional adenosylcobinamide kinase/adenosylcobinamide-phosphate guanylyltransferase [Desulfobacterota bacterium]|nr:bifunctional adenosylcobinamide kinase/adenosylcobinamide-phosphate guanylyltransferase [Thermodesulfobacteriota bacterium]
MGKKRVIFITGGCRSGKSRFALDYANRSYAKKIYLATCEPLDEEMARRIELHKKGRGPEWQTIEEPLAIVNRVSQIREGDQVVLLDCITLWISNLLLKWDDEERIMAEMERFLEAVKRSPASFILVSNEVGMGIVPAEPVARRFRDLAGTINQKLAETSDTVIFMVSGLPIFLKGRA